MKTVIIIPTLREYDNLTRLLPEIFRHLPDVDILVADDNSEDGTKGLGAKNIRILNRHTDHGYGKAVLDGFRWAIERGYDAVVTMDADFSHDPKEVPAMLATLDHHEVVIGSRYVSGGHIANWSWYRRLLSRCANWYVRAVLHTGIKDNTTGFMAYRCSAVEFLLAHQPHSEGYAFLVEVKNIIKNLTVAEHPIRYTERREGTSKMSWKVIWESIWLPWKLKYGTIHQ